MENRIDSTQCNRNTQNVDKQKQSGGRGTNQNSRVPEGPSSHTALGKLEGGTNTSAYYNTDNSCTPPIAPPRIVYHFTSCRLLAAITDGTM